MTALGSNMGGRRSPSRPRRSPTCCGRCTSPRSESKSSSYRTTAAWPRCGSAATGASSSPKYSSASHPVRGVRGVQKCPSVQNAMKWAFLAIPKCPRTIRLGHFENRRSPATAGFWTLGHFRKGVTPLSAPIAVVRAATVSPGMASSLPCTEAVRLPSSTGGRARKGLPHEPTPQAADADEQARTSPARARLPRAQRRYSAVLPHALGLLLVEGPADQPQSMRSLTDDLDHAAHSRSQETGPFFVRTARRPRT